MGFSAHIKVACEDVIADPTYQGKENDEIDDAVPLSFGLNRTLVAHDSDVSSLSFEVYAFQWLLI
jgi:hypothetical protein